jgi:hypothetical protein
VTPATLGTVLDHFVLETTLLHDSVIAVRPQLHIKV